MLRLCLVASFIFGWIFSFSLAHATADSDFRSLLEIAAGFSADDTSASDDLRVKLAGVKWTDVHEVASDDQIGKILNNLALQKNPVAQQSLVSVLSMVTPENSLHRHSVGRAVMMQLAFGRQARLEDHAPTLVKQLNETVLTKSLETQLIEDFYQRTKSAKVLLGRALSPLVKSQMLRHTETLTDYRELAAALEISNHVPIEHRLMGFQLWNYSHMKCPVPNCATAKNQGWAEVTRTIQGIAAKGMVQEAARDPELFDKIRRNRIYHWSVQNPPLPWEDTVARSYESVTSEDIVYDGFLRDPKVRKEILNELNDPKAMSHSRATQLAPYIYDDFIDGHDLHLTDVQTTQLRQSLANMGNVESYWNAWEQGPMQKVTHLRNEETLAQADRNLIDLSSGKLLGALAGDSQAALHSAPAGLEKLFPELSQTRNYLSDLGSLNPLLVRDPAALNVLAKWTSTLSEPLKDVYASQIKKLFGPHFRRAVHAVAEGKSNDVALVRLALQMNESVSVMSEAETSSLVKIFVKHAHEPEGAELGNLAMKAALRLKQAGARIEPSTVKLLLSEVDRTLHIKKVGPLTVAYDPSEAPYHADILSLLDAKDLSTTADRKKFLDEAKALAKERTTAPEIQRVLTTWPHDDEMSKTASKLLDGSTRKFGNLPASCFEGFRTLSRMAP